MASPPATPDAGHHHHQPRVTVTPVASPSPLTGTAAAAVAAAPTPAMAGELSAADRSRGRELAAADVAAGRHAAADAVAAAAAAGTEGGARVLPASPRGPPLSIKARQPGALPWTPARCMAQLPPHRFWVRLRDVRYHKSAEGHGLGQSLPLASAGAVRALRGPSAPPTPTGCSGRQWESSETCHWSLGTPPPLQPNPGSPPQRAVQLLCTLMLFGVRRCGAAALRR